MRSIYALVIALAGGLGAVGCQHSEVTDKKATAGEGRAVYLSDVESMPNSPITAGFVIAIPPSQVDAFWRSLGVQPSGALSGTEVTVSKERLDILQAQVEPITAGVFAVGGIAEGALLCLANPDQAAQPALPYRVVGCGYVPARKGPLTVSLGLGGVEVTR